jgi:hypothetical protein
MMIENGILFVKMYEALESMKKVMQMIEELRVKDEVPPATLKNIVGTADTLLKDIEPYYLETRKRIGEHN